MKSVLKFSLASAVLATSFTLPAFAEGMGDKAVGTWLRTKKGWEVEFAMCESDPTKLCGEIVSGEGKDKKTGESVVGIKMLYDLERVKDNKWKGKMYNPGDGGTYSGSVTVLSDDEIKMAGCMAGVLCRSEKWPRAAAPAEVAGE